jgi:putative redox protein
MDIRIAFPSGKRVDASFGDYVVSTDQSVAHGGSGSAPEPFDVFLASLGACAGAYVLGFCQARGISSAGIELIQHNRFDEATHRLEQVELELRLPATFPEKYREAVLRADEGCKVKKALASPPEITVKAEIALAEHSPLLTGTH